MLISSEKSALVLAPMDGITDAPMRALMGELGAFTHSVSEFLRVSGEVLPKKVFLREVPEITTECRTCTGLLVQVQILGGDPDRMAQSALNAVAVGAKSIDINFGCPAPTVNRNDGGASLLKSPDRLREIVQAVRDAVPAEIPVSAKLRLGWDSIEPIDENAEMLARGGASWITIHARTRTQGYQPPVFWEPIGRVAANLAIPVIANGDIWNRDDFLRCREMTGVRHFMIGRAALANPHLPWQIAAELGLIPPNGENANQEVDWLAHFRRLEFYTHSFSEWITPRPLMRIKQWMKLAHLYGNFPYFDVLKHSVTLEEFYDTISRLTELHEVVDREYASRGSLSL